MGALVVYERKRIKHYELYDPNMEIGDMSVEQYCEHLRRKIEGITISHSSVYENTATISYYLYHKNRTKRR